MSPKKTPPEPSLLVYRGRGDSGSYITKMPSPARAKLPVHQRLVFLHIRPLFYWFGEESHDSSKCLELSKSYGCLFSPEEIMLRFAAAQYRCRPNMSLLATVKC